MLLISPPTNNNVKKSANVMLRPLLSQNTRRKNTQNLAACKQSAVLAESTQRENEAASMPERANSASSEANTLVPMRSERLVRHRRPAVAPTKLPFC